MDTLAAFARNQAAQGQPMRAFDWNKAAAILKERNPQEAVAGLSSDMECTGGVIWRDGKPVTDKYTYLASRWAVPVLEIDGQEIECWVYMDGSGFGCDTKWPASALAILTGRP